MTKDLTVGSPLRVMIKFAFPIFLGLVLQQAYNLVDTIVVSWFVGDNAVGGVGAASSLCLMVWGAANGLCTGFCIPIARTFGAKEDSQLRKYLANSIYLSVIAVVLLMGLFLPMTGPILTWMQTAPENYDYAFAYFTVYFLGLPFAVLYNLSAGVIRALGDSSTPVKFLIVSSVCNIVLDLLFVVVFHWGVAGAAAATAISQGIAGICSLIYMIKKLPILHIRKEEWKWNGKDAAHLMGNALPLALQYCITFVGSMIIQVPVNKMGSLYANSVAYTGKVNSLLNCTFNSLGPTVSTFISQNVGARKPNRVRSGLLVGLLLSAIFSAIYIVLAMFGTPLLLQIFLPADKAAQYLELVKQYLMVMAWFSVLIGVVITHRFAMQGMGFSKIAMFSGVLELIARIIAAVVLVPMFNYWGVCFAAPMAWFFSSCFVVPGAYTCLSKLRKRFALETAAAE